MINDKINTINKGHYIKCSYYDLLIYSNVPLQNEIVTDEGSPGPEKLIKQSLIPELSKHTNIFRIINIIFEKYNKILALEKNKNHVKLKVYEID